MIITDLIKKTISTGLHLAVLTGEKLHTTMGNIIEKSKTIQERYNTEIEEDEDEENEAKADAINDEDDTDGAEPKSTRWEEYEHKLRRLVESAISKFNFIRSDDHQRMEERIAILEEKLSYIAKLVAEKNEEHA